MNQLSALLCGLLFALGLGLAGMTDPANILGFLDIAGDWNPYLLFVMGGAVATGSIAFPWILALRRPVFDKAFHLPLAATLDKRLIIGSALFGVGWGLSGYCPGPAIVSLATSNTHVLLLVMAMFFGQGLVVLLTRDPHRKVRHDFSTEES
jgi:uncharacterized membrane protein YedE/YeeE